MIPRATYRLQFHKGFPFAQGAEIAPYLAKLGVSHVYASPIAVARSGSNHGYDVVDPTRINPELGGEEGFRALAAALRGHGLGVILDIVPNHMAVGQGDNAWWLDVLEHGQASRYAHFFDIDWDAADPVLRGKIAAPFLGKPYADALAASDILLRHEPATDRLLAVAHDTHLFPIRLDDRAEVLAQGVEAFDPRGNSGRARLHALLERQHFRLAWWRTANDEINWRRFFDVTELAGLRVERDEVFEAVHALPLRLYAEGLIDGVRVDHVDGLADPAAYCRRLRARLQAAQSQRPAAASPGPAWLLVEKILAQGEGLPSDWATDGTTGYDYMNESAALLHEPEGEAALTRHWIALSGRSGDFEREERPARLETVERSFGAQLNAVVRAFHRLARSDLATRDLSAGALKRGVILLLAAFPAYRTYGTGGRISPSDAALLAAAFDHARSHCAPGEEGMLQQLAGWLAGEGSHDAGLRADAVRRFQQLSAPVSAKAVEDTAFYRYGRLLSRNDVGSDPARFAADPAQMHASNLVRSQATPRAMLTTATHDHKRGEDVRARLAALSGVAGRWIEASERWRGINTGLGLAIDPADEHQLYQMIVGAWPFDLKANDATGLGLFAERLAGWLEKALREAKLRSSWIEPNAAYERACREFLDACLDPARSGAFLADLHAFVEMLAPAAVLNSLVQTVLRCTAPGIPDLYQGAELWDLSLVDPDNRGPVDFALRERLLETEGIVSGWRDGAIKQGVVRKILTDETHVAGVFSEGDYQALEVGGARRDHVFAFLRRHASLTVLVVVPIHCAAAAIEANSSVITLGWWGDTAIETPVGMARTGYHGILTGEAVSSLRIADLLSSFPVGVFSAKS